jgi:hypothetical protein
MSEGTNGHIAQPTALKNPVTMPKLLNQGINSLMTMGIINKEKSYQPGAEGTASGENSL